MTTRSIRRLLHGVVLALMLSPSLCIPDWLENIITAPTLAPSQSKPDDSPIGSTSSTSSSTSSTTPPATTNSDTGSEHDHIDEVPVGAWAAHAGTTLWFAVDFPRQADDDYDEFVLPDDAFGEIAVPEIVPQIVPQAVPQIVPQTGQEDAEASTWLVQLAQFATTAILALCGFYDGPRAGCGGGDGGGGGEQGRRAGDRRRGRRRSADNNAGSNGGGNNNDNGDDASILGQVGDTLNGLLSGLGRGMMDALGFDDLDEDDSNGPLSDSTDERVARWRTYAMSWSAHDDTRGENGKYSKRDLDTLGWDVRRLKQGCNVKAVIQRVIRKFLESYPAIGYTQGFDYACKAILNAAGNDESSCVELFKAWAAAAGRVVTDDKMRRKVARYAFDKCSRTTRDLLLEDGVMDMKHLNKAERASTLYIHVFHRLEFPETVQAVIIDKTLKAGIHGPGVSAWVTTALLSIAQKDIKLTQDKNLTKTQMCAAAAGKVSAFSDLEKAAHTTLASFMRGYRRALR